jgi:dihydrolipoamide dehydrogenase
LKTLGDCCFKGGISVKLLVTGSGPGGYVAAIRAAQLGADVTLVEKNKVGGTCLNVGCIPTKVLLHGSGLVEEMKTAAVYGITGDNISLDYKKLQAYKEKAVGKLVGGVQSLLKANGVRLIKGEASFNGINSVTVHTAAGLSVIEFDRAIIAAGSEVAKVPIPGADLPQVIDSDTALSLDTVPNSLAIIGGGVIGVELGTVFSRLGCKVTIVEALERILLNLDGDLASEATASLKKQGVTIHTAARVTGIEPEGEGALVRFTCTGEQFTVTAAKVLMCVGRRPNTKGLNLEAAGIKTERSAVIVDHSQRTNVKHIFAIGDCTGGLMLAHVASAQGIVAAGNACLEKNDVFDPKTVPGCVYIEPELAGVGLTEEAARKSYSNVKIGKFPLMANGKTMLMGGRGFVKLVVDGATEEILGLHIAGPRATDIIAEGALALRLEATTEEIISTVHAHPTITEAVLEAAEDVHGRCIHFKTGRNVLHV